MVEAHKYGTQITQGRVLFNTALAIGAQLQPCNTELVHALPQKLSYHDQKQGQGDSCSAKFGHARHNV